MLFFFIGNIHAYREWSSMKAFADRQHLSRFPYVRVYYVEEALACGALLREWRSMLLSQLACFTHSVDSFRIEGRKSDYDSLRLHRAELLEVYVADSLVPQLDACFRFETFGIHGRFYVIRVEDE